MADNILEAVLDPTLASRFDKIDNFLTNIQANTKETVSAIKDLNTTLVSFVSKMQGATQSVTGFANAISGIGSSVNTGTFAGIGNAISGVGSQAVGSIEAVNMLSSALNKFSKGRTSNITEFINGASLKELKAAMDYINEQLLKWKSKGTNTIFPPDQEQALVNIRDLMKEIFDFRNKSTEKQNQIATKQAEDEAKAMKKAYDEYYDSIKKSRKDDLEAEKQEDKERTAAKKKEIEEMKAAWNAYFAQRDREENAANTELNAIEAEIKNKQQLAKQKSKDREDEQKALNEYYDSIKKKRKDDLDAEKREGKERTEAKKREIEEMKAAWNAYFAKRDRDAKAEQKAFEDSIKELEAKRRLAQNNRNSFSGALAYSNNAKTLEQERRAIEALKIARDRLSQSSPDYQSKVKQLNEEIKRHEKNIKAAAGAQEKFTQQSQKLGISLRNLASTFGIVFSVQSLANFGRKIVEITGEFELQHRSLQAIIGDMDAANKLWDKTIALAVKSPYRVKDLVSYTKQLAAYRIETEKLYDTTKMLADISSGLGVDMQRLILAYGQVKAANYLRGQELRQFSEAGVNILGELANYFSELQGRAISTGEVFEMVSKRMVKFEDVATVLRRLTEEGGVFFNMQEIQAETLQGKMMNLRDSFDIMMNSIGESRKGGLKWLVDSAKYMLDNWQSVGNTLKWVTGLWVAYIAVMKTHSIQVAAQKALIRGTTIETTLLTRVMGLFDARVKQATVSTHAFSAALKANPFGIVLGVLSALAGVFFALKSHIEQANEAQEKLNRIDIESAATTTKMVSQYKEMAAKIRDTSTSEKERTELMSKMQRLYKDILPDRLLNIDYITREGNAYGEATKAIAAYYQEQRRQRKIEAVEAEYGKRVEDTQESAAKNIQKQIKSLYGIEVSLLDINAVLGKLREELESGTTSADNLREALARLMKAQTGVPIDFGLVGIDDMGNSAFEFSTLKIIKWFDKVREYNQQLSDATIDSRFGESLIKDIESKIKGTNTLIENFAQKLNEQGADIVTKADEISKQTIGKFKAMWNAFKETDTYKNNSDFYDNYFEVNIRPIIDEAAFDVQEKWVKDKAAEFIKEFNISTTKGLESLIFDSSKQTMQDWYKEVLHPMVETMEAEMRLIMAGASLKPAEEIARITEQLPMVQAMDKAVAALFDDKKKKTGSSGNPALQLLNKQIEAIKNASKQYEEYQKLYDDTTAFTKTKNAVQDLFGQLGIGGLLNKQGIFDKMTIQSQLTTWLSGQMAKAGKDGRIAIEKYVRELELQASQADFKKMVDNFKRNMDEAFADYDMYKELEKLGIGKDFASLLFGVQTFDDKQLSQKFEQAKRHLLSIYDGDEAQKAVAEMQRKIDEAEDKAQKERLKKYVAYTKQAMTERAKIEVEGLQELAEIEMTFQKEIAKAQNAGNTERASQIKQLMDAAVAGSKRATNEKLQKQAWEDFKGSDMYVEMFNDIGNASTKVIEAIQGKITQLRGSLKDLNPSDLKAITQEITKLEDELIKRNPAKSYFDLFKQVRDMQKQGKGEDALMLQMGANDAEIENLNDQIAGYERLIEKRRQFNQEQIDSEGEGNYLKINMSLQSQVEEWKKLVDQKKKDNALTAEELATYKRFRNASQEFANYLQNMGGRVTSVFSDIMSNLEAFGGETTNTTEAWGDLFTSITSIIATIPNYILLMKAAGVAANEALGVIGWIITAAELLMSLIKGIANIKNAQIDDEIEGYRKSVDGLSDAYDRLENKFDSVWDIERLRNYNSEMKRNIEEQIGYYDKMIDAEMRRKSPDQGIIDDYRKSIQDLRDDIANQGNDFLTEVGGLGTDSYKDAAQGFVDAWYDAFKETGDGLEGLRDNFNEILENMVKRQAVMRLTDAILDPLFKEIDTAAGDGTITNAEMDAINSLAESTFPTLNEKLKAFFQSLGMFGEQAEGELDGLQKGIQGVTEQTAEIIAAYMNAIRYYVIDNNTKLGQIVGIVQDNTGAANPMLAELRSLRQRADDIHYLLNGWRETNGIDSMRVTIVN